MGSAKEEMMNNQEHNRNKKLAEILGITYHELELTKWKMEEEKSKDGLVLHQLVIFDKGSPKNILNKITGLDENNTVLLDPNELISNKDFDEEELGGEG